jgi:hypothetical protein
VAIQAERRGRRVALFLQQDEQRQEAEWMRMLASAKI